MEFVKQVCQLTGLGLTRSLRSRASMTSMIFCIGCAVAILIVMFSMDTGLKATTLKNIRSDRAFVVAAGSRILALSAISRDKLATMEGARGIASGAGPGKLFAPIVTVMADVERRRGGGRIAVPVIGVGPAYHAVYPELKLVRGRLFQPGVHEVIVGRAATRRVVGAELGATITLKDVQWLVVGEFEQNGGSAEQAIVTDAETLMSAFRIRVFNAAAMLVDTADGGLGALKADLQANPDLQVNVKSEQEVLNDEIRSVSGPLNFVSSVVVTFMLLGAALAAVNAMFSVIDARGREIATLRAIGFSDGRILIAVILEMTVLVIPGAVLGAMLAFVLCSDSNVELLGRGIPMLVTAPLMWNGIFVALCVGLLGGIFPALRAVKRSVADALGER